MRGLILRQIGHAGTIPLGLNIGLFDLNPESDQSIHLPGQLISPFHHFSDFLPVEPVDFVELVVGPPEEDKLVLTSFLGGHQERCLVTPLGRSLLPPRVHEDHFLIIFPPHGRVGVSPVPARQPTEGSVKRDPSLQGGAPWGRCLGRARLRPLSGVKDIFEDSLKLKHVYYPGLPSHPEHYIAKQQMTGFGGVVSFEVDGDLTRTTKFVDSLKIPYIAPSFGECERIVDQPAIMSYWDLSRSERAKYGILDNLVRCSFGVKDFEGLKADILRALDAI